MNDEVYCLNMHVMIISAFNLVQVLKHVSHPSRLATAKHSDIFLETQIFLSVRE